MARGRRSLNKQQRRRLFYLTTQREMFISISLRFAPAIVRFVQNLRREARRFTIPARITLLYCGTSFEFWFPSASPRSHRRTMCASREANENEFQRTSKRAYDDFYRDGGSLDFSTRNVEYSEEHVFRIARKSRRPRAITYASWSFRATRGKFSRLVRTKCPLVSLRPTREAGTYRTTG